MTTLKTDKQAILDIKPHPKSGLRRGMIVIGLMAVAALMVLAAVLLNRRDEMISLEPKVLLNNESVSPDSILYQMTGTDTPLLDTQALLVMLGLEEQWLPFVPSSEEIRYSAQQGRVTAYILDGWSDLQIYQPDTGSAIYNSTSAAIVKNGKAYIPLSFVSPWLGYDAVYNVNENLIRFDAIAKEIETTPPVSNMEATAESSLPEQLPAEDALPSSSEEQTAPVLPERIDLSYTYLDGDGEPFERQVYAYLEDDSYGFREADGTLLTGAYYARVGSPSQPEFIVYQGADGNTIGIVAGWYRPDRSILYGVLSLEAMDWVVPCRYENLYLEGNVCYGLLDGAGVQVIGEVVP